MKKVLFLSLILFFFSLFLYPLYNVFSNGVERGVFSVYFMGEKVGYEEYTWEEDEQGFLLNVKGKMTKPTTVEVENLVIRLSNDYIAESYEFEGSVNGIPQRVSSTIKEGYVQTIVQISGQEQFLAEKIRRDAFLLPNPIFSPYMVITKKFRCSPPEKIELSAYIIPQLEIPFLLEAAKESVCLLQFMIGSTPVALQTNDSGCLKSLEMPSQKIKVVADSQTLDISDNE